MRLSDRLRRNAIKGIAVSVILWPLVHLALVAWKDVDPWEFFGWAMYSRPAARVQVRVEVEREAGRVEPLRAMGPLRRRVEGFARARSTLGHFASSEPLQRAVFDSDASIEAITIITRDVRLDRESARLVGVAERLRFARSSLDPQDRVDGARRGAASNPD